MPGGYFPDSGKEKILTQSCPGSPEKELISRIQELVRISCNNQEKADFCKENKIRPEDFYIFAFGYIAGLIMALEEKRPEADRSGKEMLLCREE